jgi:pimeloyl-ACP methyl ester carboxylesterase
VLLIHGLSSIAGTWWRIGPALAARGWDVTAVDQAGHGGRPVRGEVDAAGLAAAVLEVHPEAPDVLIGHSLGTVAAIGLLEREPGWAGTVILEEPPSRLAPQLCVGMAESITADAAAVREDRAGLVERIRREQPRWADEDVYWAVEGIAEMDPAPFARRLRALAEEGEPAGTPERILAAEPTPHVIAASSERPLLDGGSALSRADRAELAHRLPAGHVVELDGGHCLHRDAPAEWLAAVAAVLS